MATGVSARVTASSASRALCGLAILVAFAGLGGCTSLELLLGMRIRLDKIPVTRLSAALAGADGLAPGKSAGLIVTATATDGTPYVTEGAGHGKVLFDSFEYDPTLVTVSPHGLVSLPADPRLSEGKLPHLRIAVKGRPGVTADIDIPVRYDAEFDARFVGRAGSAGFYGTTGFNGSYGMAGSTDANNPSPGGNGSDGTSGGDGSDGGPGAAGPPVSVWLTRSAGPGRLIQARVIGDGPEQLFLIDPDRGSLVVESNGGAGGAAGRGGRGGTGGAGGSGTPAGFSGTNGRDGSDGRPGRGVPAGTIEVTVDPSAEGFLARLRLSNRSGDGIAGPAPTTRTEPVPPLW